MITSRQFKSALIAALIFAASAYPGRAQPVPQAPAGNAVPVTADNFNRAETDMYFGKRVKRGGIGHLSHSRELYLTDSPVVAKVVWGSRYPHHDATSAWDALTRLRSANVPETLIAHMMGGNAARQFALQPLRETAS